MCVSVSGLAKVNTWVCAYMLEYVCVSVSGPANIITWVCAYVLEYVCECEWTCQGEYVGVCVHAWIRVSESGYLPNSLLANLPV